MQSSQKPTADRERGIHKHRSSSDFVVRAAHIVSRLTVAQHREVALSHTINKGFVGSVDSMNNGPEIYSGPLVGSPLPSNGCPSP